MLHSLLSSIDQQFKLPKVSAHCDIPCKIYDPSTAQIAALTIIRLADLINEIASKDDLSVENYTQLSRLANQKEAHGLTVKEEIRIIWGDYFKQAQFEQVPDIHELVHTIMLQASKAKQGIDRNDAVELLSLVNQFAEAFWKTKGVDTFKATCPYPPSETVVYPKLEG